MFAASATAAVSRVVALRTVTASSRHSNSVAVLSAATTRSLSMYGPIKVEQVDLDKVFDEIDTDHSGTITREEFKAAMGRLRYTDLLKIHDAAHANMEGFEKKLKKLEEIEQDMLELKELTEKKYTAYNNVGMTTAAELEDLFNEAKIKRRRVKSNIGEVKGLIASMKQMFSGSGGGGGN